jgi:hypothetical protein
MSEEDTEMAYWTVYGLDGDPELPCIGNCPSSTDMGSFLVNLVGAGNPCFVFTTLPTEILTADPIAANFNTGMIVSSDYQTNRLAVAAMLESPPEVATTPQDPETTTAVVWPSA